MRKWWLLIWLVLLTGCSRLQLEDRLLAVSMGLERTPQGELRISVQVPTGNPEGEDYKVVTAQGPDWEGAMDALERQSPHRLNFSQLRQVVVHEDLAGSEAFAPLLKQIYRRHQIRASAYVIVTPSDCQTLLQMQKPDVGQHLGKYLDTVMKNLVARQYVPNAALGQVVRDLLGGVGDPPLIWAQAAGERIEYMGAALTSRGRVAGRLNGQQMQLLALLTSGGYRINLRTEDGKPVEVSAFQGGKVKMDPEGGVKIELQVTAYGPVTEGPARQEVEAALEKEMLALIRQMQAIGSDGAALARHAQWGKATLAEVNRWDFAGAEISVSVKAQMVISAT